FRVSTRFVVALSVCSVFRSLCLLCLYRSFSLSFLPPFRLPLRSPLHLPHRLPLSLSLFLSPSPSASPSPISIYEVFFTSLSLSLTIVVAVRFVAEAAVGELIPKCNLEKSAIKLFEDCLICVIPP
ncbi:unnamed protein product, partial [Citrullus colocynthis]